MSHNADENCHTVATSTDHWQAPTWWWCPSRDPCYPRTWKKEGGDVIQHVIWLTKKEWCKIGRDYSGRTSCMHYVTAVAVPCSLQLLLFETVSLLTIEGEQARLHPAAGVTHESTMQFHNLWDWYALTCTWVTLVRYTSCWMIHSCRDEWKKHNDYKRLLIITQYPPLYIHGSTTRRMKV